MPNLLGLKGEVVIDESFIGHYFRLKPQWREK
jgi:hypothetical protein